MAVAVIIDFPDGNAQKYEQVTGKLFPEGKLPEGWQVHIAGPAGNGWQVVNVVPSQEQFETFAREQLLPAAQQAGDAPPQITFFPVYRLIQTGGIRSPAARPSKQSRTGKRQAGRATGRVRLLAAGTESEDHSEHDHYI
jgi:hypothetical protein